MGKREKKTSSRARAGLRVLRTDVAGIDIGSREHWVSAPPSEDGEPNVRVFRTVTKDLEALADWLETCGVRSVAMESTHVYWIPVLEVLEGRGFEVLLVDARQFRNVPGRKTDMHDCQWLQQLHSCGLLRGCFRPSAPIADLRTIYRHIDNLAAERNKALQWMQKALDQMNVQVHRAVSHIAGVTGMAMVRAIVDGERDPKKLAQYRDKRCHKSEAQMAEYLTGTWKDAHLCVLASALRSYDGLQAEIERCENDLLAKMERLYPAERREESLPKHPNARKQRGLNAGSGQRIRTALWRLSGVDLTRIDGISVSTANILINEVGFDLASFPDEKHFISWLRLSPRIAVSGGKPLKKRRKGLGSNRVAGALRMAATTLQRTKTALGASFRRIAARKGYGVAVFATARKLASIVYRMLRFGHAYTDVGQAAYEARYRLRRLAALSANAQALGFNLVANEAPS